VSSLESDLVDMPSTTNRAPRFAGCSALVTGGASGIGAAVVRRLAADGCSRVVVADINVASARELAAEVGVGIAAQVDVTDPASVCALFEQTIIDVPLDVVVHSAGVDDPASKAALQEAQASGEPLDAFRHISDATWRRLMSVNLDGTFYVLRSAVAAMIPNGSGAIVTISSSAAFDALEGYSPYAASKAGAKILAQSVAKEAIRHGVRVNTIAPGPVNTPMATRTSTQVQRALNASGALGYASADEIAETICFLASPAARNLVGAVLLSNGGRFTV